jgi:hypothetical protein
MLRPMGDMLKLIWWAVIGLFRSRVSLEAEILTLRHQLTVLRRKSPNYTTALDETGDYKAPTRAVDEFSSPSRSLGL